VKNKKLRVGILMGGRSGESQISLGSGKNVLANIDLRRFDIVPIFQKKTGELFRFKDFENLCEERIYWENIKSLVDVVFIALHGQYAEDGTIQGLLEMLDIPYLGSKVLSSSVCINKSFQKNFLKLHGIDVPDGFELNCDLIKNVECINLKDFFNNSKINFPCIVKPSCEGSSLGISIANSFKELIPALKKASFDCAEKNQNVLIEEKIIGSEFTCSAIENYDGGKWKFLPVTEVAKINSDLLGYDQKYMPGGYEKITPAILSDSDSNLIKEVIIKSVDILKIESFFRIDGILTEDKKFVILDVNTIPGMGALSFFPHQIEKAGIDLSECISYLIDLELEKYKSRYEKDFNKKTESLNSLNL